MELEGKVAIVTGATRGIGKEIALHLAAKGCQLVLTATDGHALEELHKTLPEAVTVVGDIRKISTSQRIVRTAIDSFGRIDILINDAGVAWHKSLENTSDDIYDAIMDVNVKGVFMLTREALSNIRKSKGTVVNISSISGTVGVAGLSVYSASKWAIIGFTESMAEEEPLVSWYAICPGSVETDMYHKLYPGSHARLKPEEVAYKVVETLKKEPRRTVIEVRGH